MEPAPVKPEPVRDLNAMYDHMDEDLNDKSLATLDRLVKEKEAGGGNPPPVAPAPAPLPKV